MMCFDRNQRRSKMSYQANNSMAPSSQSYLASCLQTCSYIWDSIWNPFGKIPAKLQLLDSKNNNFTTEELHLNYSNMKHHSEKLSTEAFLMSMIGNTRSSFISDFYNMSFIMLPNDLMHHGFRDHNKGTPCTLLKQPPMVKSILNQPSVVNSMLNQPSVLNQCFSSVIAVDKVMMEPKVVKTAQDCAPKALPVGLSAPKRHKKASLTVSVIKVQRGVEILNQELINRKNRELRKCSKKRRRRQKKQESKCDNSVSSETSKSAMHKTDVKALSTDEKRVNGVTESESSKNCMNPLISFILGQASENESDSESDFVYETDQADIEFCFTDTLSAVTVGLKSISILPEDSKHARADCTISIVNFTDASPEVIDANKRWNKLMADVKPKPGHITKVSFPQNDELATICPVEIYDRKGEWEIFALERFRFKRRIEEAERIISPVLATHHREKVLQKLDMCVKQSN